MLWKRKVLETSVVLRPSSRVEGRPAKLSKIFAQPERPVSLSAPSSAARTFAGSTLSPARRGQRAGRDGGGAREEEQGQEGREEGGEEGGEEEMRGAK